MDAIEIIKKFDLNSNILHYYFCPEINVTSSGNKESTVTIRRISTDKIQIRCPDIRTYVGNPNKTIEMTEIELPISELNDKNSVYMMFIDMFCFLTPKRKEWIRESGNWISLCSKSKPAFVGKKITPCEDIKQSWNDVNNFKALRDECLKTNDFIRFTQICKNISRLLSTVPDVAKQFGFCRKDSSIRTAFEVMRYDYLVVNKKMLRNADLKTLMLVWTARTPLKEYEFLDDEELFSDFSYSLRTYLKVRERYIK